MFNPTYNNRIADGNPPRLFVADLVADHLCRHGKSPFGLCLCFNMNYSASFTRLQMSRQKDSPGEWPWP